MHSQTGQIPAGLCIIKYCKKSFSVSYDNHSHSALYIMYIVLESDDEAVVGIVQKVT